MNSHRIIAPAFPFMLLASNYGKRTHWRSKRLLMLEYSPLQSMPQTVCMEIKSCSCPCHIMLLFHWLMMPWRSYGIHKNEQIHSKIAEMVWWNISGATISHVLCINCVSMAHGWRTCATYGKWMAMPQHMMSHMRTWPLHIHGASGICTAYIPRMSGDQRDSMVYGGRMYSVWAAYKPNL